MERDYQQWGIDAILRYFEENEKPGNPVIAMPTGTGKSHMISGLIRRMIMCHPSTRFMMLTHVKELIEQNYKKFIEAWPNAPIGIYSAGLDKREFHYPITFGGIQSVGRKPDLFGHIDILFIDECDLVSDKEETLYRTFIKGLMTENPKLKVIGLTATDWRQGVGKITDIEGGIFTHTPVDMTGVDAFNWFTDNGYLAPLISKPTRVVLETDNLHIRAGDFIEKEMQIAYDKREITIAALQEALDLGGDRKSWLIFSSGIEHAKNIAHEATMLGIECEAIYNGMGKRRKEIVDAHKAGELRAIVNNNILTTGYDNPRVDLIMILRATASSRLWVQMLGRGTRPCYMPGYDLSTPEGRLEAIAMSDKHNCMILDYSRNIERLGPINDPVIPRKKGKGGPQPAPVKKCTACDNYNHASARYCGGKPKDHPQFDPARGCGHEFLFEVKLKVNASTQDVVKVSDLPVVQTFPVQHVTYQLHEKVGAPPILKVTYYSGLKSFHDYVCVEHTEGSPGRGAAISWWRERDITKGTVPKDVDDALDQAEFLKVPTHIDVHTNTKYPRIKRYCYDGTEFNRIQISSPHEITIPSVDTKAKRAHGPKEEATQFRVATYVEDDDIPF